MALLGTTSPGGTVPGRGRRKKRARALGPSLVPPQGLYDPALDAAAGAAQRGYGDFQADSGRDFGADVNGNPIYGAGRGGHDYLAKLGQLDLGHTRAGEDFTTQRAGINRGFGRGQQDYWRNVGDLKRSYGRLAGSQAQNARRSGVMSGGLAARAAQIRAGNQAHDRAPLDTGFARLGQDRTLGLTAVGRQQTREGQDYTFNRGEAGLGYQRQLEDAGTGLTRAGREAGQFNLDTNASRVFSATQQGWDPYAGAVAPGGKPRSRRPRGRGRLRGTTSPGGTVAGAGWR